MTNQNNAAQAANENPLSDEYVNAIIQRHGYDSPESVIAQLHQWIGLHGGEDTVTLLMYEAHKVLSKLRAPVADERAAVAYLDLGTGGYMDVGTDLTDEQLAALPKGRHMLAIIGTHGVNGYTPASAPVAGEAQPVASLGVVLGMGEYLIQTTASGEPAQVVFSQATDHDRATRTIGDLKVGGHGPFDHSRIRGQIQFTSAVALDALEVQLRELRKEHWPDTLDAAPQASALDTEYTRGRADGFDAGYSAALEKAAAALEDHRRAGREWVPGSLWDTLSREAAARIRALKQPQADKEGGQQRAGDVDERAVLDGVRAALPEFRQQDDYLLAHGASLMSENSHEIIHIDTVRCIIRAALSATQPEQGERDA
ncbi:hypothetical protein A9G00_24585 [Achromobacter xylosoxidans]|nr:hypothetical protein A9G00_24585 [Achromobacter xylosoxidans]